MPVIYVCKKKVNIIYEYFMRLSVIVYFPFNLSVGKFLRQPFWGLSFGMLFFFIEITELQKPFTNRLYGVDLDVGVHAHSNINKSLQNRCIYYIMTDFFL